MSYRTRLIEEIIKHEFEKHDLHFIELTRRNVHELCRSLTGKIPESDNKQHIYEETIRCLYENLNYTEFIEQKKREAPDSRFARTWKSKLRLLLNQRFAKSPRTEEDKHLCVGHPTLSYLLSELYYSEIFTDFSRYPSPFKTPYELREFFLQPYPILFSQLLERLRKEDPEFWEPVILLIKRIAESVTNRKLSSSVSDRDIASDIAYTETYEVMRKKIVAEKNDLWKNVPAFRKYIRTTCEYKNLEFIRKWKSRIRIESDRIEDSAVSFCDLSEQEKDYENNTDMAEVEIDTQNPFAVARLVASILLNENHRLYGRLVRNEKDRQKAELLIDIAVRGLSYEEVIDCHLDGKVISALERERLYTNLRQEYSRAKSYFMNRLKTVLEKDEKMYPSPG